MNRNLRVGMSALALVCMTAQANPVTYFGENQLPGGAFVSGDPVTARASFLSTLTNVGVETFGNAAVASSPFALTFVGTTVTGTLTGGGQIFNTPFGGRYNTTGATASVASAGAFYENVADTTTFMFSQAISAFGFYATDVGDRADAGVQLSVELLSEAGVKTTLTIPNTVNGANGALLFWGFTDASVKYTSVSVSSASPSDVYTFDDLTMGTVSVMPPPTVPEPATLALVGLSLLGVAASRRKRG